MRSDFYDYGIIIENDGKPSRSTGAEGMSTHTYNTQPTAPHWAIHHNDTTQLTARLDQLERDIANLARGVAALTRLVDGLRSQLNERGRTE